MRMYMHALNRMRMAPHNTSFDIEVTFLTSMSFYGFDIIFLELEIET